MKTSIQKQLGLLLSAAIITLPAFASKPNRQDRTVTPFSKITVSSGIDLYLVQGAKEQVTVEADGELIDQIITKVEGETLQIYIENQNNWKWGWNRERKVYVTFDDLTSLNASAGSDVLAETKIKLDKISISSSSGADVSLNDMEAAEVHVETSSGADAEITGKTHVLFADSSSGSDIDCSELRSDICTAHASSGSDIVLYAVESLTASASSGADIQYKGDPGQRTIDESSGGDISKY